MEGELSLALSSLELSDFARGSRVVVVVVDDVIGLVTQTGSACSRVTRVGVAWPRSKHRACVRSISLVVMVFVVIVMAVFAVTVIFVVFGGGGMGRDDQAQASQRQQFDELHH